MRGWSFLRPACRNKGLTRVRILLLSAFHQNFIESTFKLCYNTTAKRDTDWRERVVTWEMDLRIMEKRAHEKGKKEKALEIAEALRKKGMSEDEIAEVTGLPEKKEALK